MWDAVAKFSSRYAFLVIGLWVLVAAAGNLLVPQVEHTARTHAQGFLPHEAQVNAVGAIMAREFGDGGGANLNYLVLEGDRPLGPAERAYHDDLLARLRADTAHVESVMDLWSDPITAEGAESADGKAAYTMLRLRGELGAAQANESVAAVREIVAGHAAPSGLRVLVSGPGAVISDQITAIDEQMLVITGATVVLIALLLLLVYRNLVTAHIPLLTVGLALAVTRPIIAFLGERDLIEVSIFSVSLLGALVLGAATDYAIFVLGRYHEIRRSGVPHDAALLLAYRSVAPVILGSGLTVAAALAFLILADIGMLSSAGLPCAIGVLTGMLAALTLLPAIIAVAGKRGYLRPRARVAGAGGRWRPIGTLVARWPGPALVGSVLVLVLCALPAAQTRLGFDELAAIPDTTEATAGFQAMDRHFPENSLLPEIVFIRSDHDLRDPAGVIAIERVTRGIMEIPGIRMVQSASRPSGAIPEQAALTAQAGLVADQLDSGTSQMAERLGAIDEVAASLRQLETAIGQLQLGLSGAADGIGALDQGVGVMQSGMRTLRDNVGRVSEYMAPLRAFTGANPGCARDGLCALVLDAVEPMDAVVAATESMTSGAETLGGGAQDLARVFATTNASVETMRATVARLGSVTAQLTAAVAETRTMFSGLVEYLRAMRADFRNSGEGGFYLPQQAWSDPRFQRAAQLYFSPDGRSARLMVFGEGKMFGADGAERAAEILLAVHEATKEGTLAGSTANTTGFGTGTAELREFVIDDFLLLAIAALAMVFLIVLVMLRSPIAAAVVIGTVVLSYISAIGISTVIWQDLIGKDLHWPVPTIALIALVAVGADYNLMLTMRLREEVFERGAGLRTGMIRAFAGTGAVVTVAGLVFGLTMFALLTGTVLSIMQVGTSVGIGLLIDTLIVRTFVVPGMAGLLGRWFWWTPAPLVRGLIRHRPARAAQPPNAAPSPSEGAAPASEPRRVPVRPGIR
ncbi:RND family transporter [Nocardia sp. NPDC050697]|uniref:MMPL/RND family transporter n=1 Tax=Nocardia sp. NPDC050697 TaxID=3155158 RepID=UPI0033F658BF